MGLIHLFKIFCYNILSFILKQSVESGEWKGLDFGSAEANLKHWNSEKPPQYNYSVVSTICIMYILIFKTIRPK